MNFTLLPSSSVLIQSSSRMFVACACNVLNVRCDLFSPWPRCSWVLDTNVGGKLFVALGFVLLLHFIQGFVKGRARGLEQPVALGATEALKVLFLNPHQHAWHGGSIRP